MPQIVLIRVSEIRAELRAMKKVARSERPNAKNQRQKGLLEGIIACCDRMLTNLPKG